MVGKQHKDGGVGCESETSAGMLTQFLPLLLPRLCWEGSKETLQNLKKIIIVVTSTMFEDDRVRWQR